MTQQLYSRRSLLQAFGAAGVVLSTSLLAACGGGAPPSTANAPTKPATQAAAAPNTAAQPTPTTQAQIQAAPTTAQPTAVPAKALAPVTIRTAHSWDAVFWKRQQSFDATFMKQHTNIKVHADNVPWAQWVTKLSTEAAAGTAPDVQYCQFANARKFTYDGLFINLQPRINQDPEFAPDLFTPTSLITYRYKGNLHIVPYDEGPLIIFYNIDMFNKYGIPLPKPDWTLTDMLQAAKSATRGTGIDHTWGYEGSPGGFGGEVNPNYMYPLGAAFLDPNEVKFLADTPEAVSALQWWADLRLKYKVNPSPAETKVVPGDAFAFGKMAMMFSGSWSVPWLHAQAKFQYDVAAFPAGPKKHTTSTMGSGYGITKDSKDHDAAWTYEKAYLGEKGVEYMWGETGRGSPARKKAWQSYFKSPLAPKSAHLIYDALTTYANHDILQSPNGAEITRVANQTWDLVLLGHMPVKDALNKIGSDLIPVLKKNEPYVGLFG